MIHHSKTKISLILFRPASDDGMTKTIFSFFSSSLSLDFSPKNLITIHIKKLEETKEMTANIIFPSHFSSSIVKLKFYSLRKREIRDNFIFPSLIKEKYALIH